MAEQDGGSVEVTDDVDWKSGLPEPVRAWQEVETSDTQEKFWDQMSNMRSRMGNSVRIPGPDASDEAKQEFFSRLQSIEGVTRIPGQDDGEGWATLYNRIGRPQKAEEYSFDADSQTKEFFHGLGLSDAQAQRLVEAETERRKNTSDERQGKTKEDYNALMSEWGEAATRKLSGIKHVLQKFDDTGVLGKALEDPDFQYAPEMLRALGNIGDLFLEKSPPGANNGQSWGMTPEEARERANEMLHNPDSPRNNPNHPNHQQAQKDYMRLRRIATGEARA